jgi:prolipoprotein diacylglyceryltransferase
MQLDLLGAAVLSVVCLYAVLRVEAGRTNPADCTRAYWDVVVGAILIGVFAGRIAAMVIGGTNPLAHPADILIVRSGVDTGYASLAALVSFVLLARRDPLAIADALAPAALGGLAGWHASCVFRGLCAGTPTDLPWAIHTSGSNIGRHPIELYAALLLLAAAGGLILWKRLRRPPLGVIAGAALVLAGGIRLLSEPFRPGLGAGPGWWYLAGIGVGLAVVAWRWAAGKPGEPLDPGC